MKRKNIFVLIVGIMLCFTAMVFLSSWLYMNLTLSRARAEGIYDSPEQGMLAKIDEHYTRPYEAEVIYSGTNSFDGRQPHVWYVIACIWADQRADGSPVGSVRHDYDQPGSFYINMKDGWVHVSEGYFPRLLGFWMEFYGLAGPGSSVPNIYFDDNPDSKCEF